MRIAIGPLKSCWQIVLSYICRTVIFQVLRNCTILVIGVALCIDPPWDSSAEASELWAVLVSSTSPQAFASEYGVDGVAPSAEV